MFDLIEILAAPLSLILIVFAFLSLQRKSYFTGFVFLVVAILPMLWAGYFRLPIPQTLVWMGMNICVILFLWQGFIGVVVNSSNADVLSMPLRFSKRIKGLFSCIIGAVFAVLIILTRI